MIDWDKLDSLAVTYNHSGSYLKWAEATRIAADLLGGRTRNTPNRDETDRLARILLTMHAHPDNRGVWQATQRRDMPL